jgi:hypothetical protein
MIAILSNRIYRHLFGREAFDAIRAARVDGLAVNNSPQFSRDTVRLAQLALEARLPTACEWREMAQQGCVLSYGPVTTALWGRVVEYVERMLKGTSPHDMPVEQPTRFELVLNLKSAKVLGIEIPPAFLARADEVRRRDVISELLPAVAERYVFGMKRVAVFGNTGAGKSALAKRLSELTRLPLYPIDIIQYRAGGGKVPHEEYLQAHADILAQDEWIIDGYGCVASAWERFSRADTLVYIDLPLATHYWWVTKRLVRGLFSQPGGLAGEQPYVAQHHQQLQGGMALPPSAHAPLQAACRQFAGLESGAPPEISRRDSCLHRKSKAGASHPPHMRSSGASI